MRRRGLLSLLCLSLLFLSLVQLTRARGELKVNETTTRILLEKEPAEILLAVENSSGEVLKARVEVELLDPRDNTKAKTSQIQSIGNGSQKLRLSLPLSFSNLSEKERSQLLWYRLRYRLTQEESPDNTIQEGIVSLSEITPDLFDIRVATSEIAREGGRYRARVHASHPITRRPAANVRVDGEVTLEADNDKSVKLSATRITDSNGYAVLDFALPPRFPEFPHNTRPSGGELHVVATRGSVNAKASTEILVDQFARILVSSDKPLYQPGQVMHLRALVFTPSKRALANQNIVIKISDPEEINIFRTVVKSSRFGIANADWSIPENTRLGDYRISVGVDGNSEYTETYYDVRISRYDLPNFSVSVDPDRKSYLPGQNAEVKVRADYLFGQPVARGHVRVVRETEREWNYREQKWDIEEGDKYEGEINAKGFFVAHINLANAHADLSDSDYRRFRDVTYAAYFTDPTTNRTEQRRFDLRVTKEAIHVYVLQDDYSWSQNRTLPLRFYVSTFYADGSPARCQVSVRLTNSSNDSENVTSKSLASLRTNRYGLAKVSGLRLPRELKDESEVDLVVSAVDSRGLKGSNKEDVSLDNSQTVVVETAKALYQAGEPVTALITSSVPDQTLVVDLARDSSVIRSERVQLHHGRAAVTFSYKPDFKDQLTIAAYPDFPDSQRSIGTRTILFPRNPELKVNVQTSQTSYRPGEDAKVNLSVRVPDGGSAESALGVVVLDKAVEERFRTDQEFGHHGYSFNQALERFLGSDEQLAGVSFRDLQRLDMSKPVSPEFDLLAEVLLNQNRDYYPSFHGGDQYEREQEVIFGKLISEQLKPLREALASHYASTTEYPKDEASLRRLMLQAQIDLNKVRDPWGMAYRAVFSVDKQLDVLNLWSTGADKHFDTRDDLLVGQQGWPYFRPLGEVIDKVVRQYHLRTGSFIRHSMTLDNELLKEGLDLDQVRDRWGQPYYIDFNVNESHYVIRVRSRGPDKLFSPDPYNLQDDFIIWTSSIDYFAEPRAQIDSALNKYFNSTGKVPQTDAEFSEALPNSGELLKTLRDPWGRRYYAIYKTYSTYADRVKVENQANLGTAPTTRTIITPVTRVVASIALRSMGPDGREGTVDDFAVSTFLGVISERETGRPEPQPSTAGVVLSENSGAIYGVVTDVQGASIPEATITATSSPQGQAYRSSSNEEGKYSIALPPGMYEVRFEARGFTVGVFTNVLVRASNLTEVNATLQVGTAAQTVTVTSEAGANMQTEASEVSVSASRSTVDRNMTAVTKSGGPRQISTPRLREYFPETLVWQPSIETDKQGRAQINFKLADNITTWKMAVIGSTEDGRIGTSETEIKSFQPFFVEHDPPRVLTEGDEISLPVVVRNYLERPQKVDLEIKPESWFSLLGPARKRTDVVAGDATRETFDLRATSSIKDGKQRITASGSDENDAIEKPVTVHPDGEEISVTAGDILGSSAELELSIPETMIRNSKRAELKIYPNLLAHVIESVEAIMARPYACGEQTISSTYPSLLLLRHYKKSHEDFPLRARAQRYLEDGYSRLLNYRAEDGGFTYWGHGEPDVALTAYALRFLTDAATVLSVDKQVIKETREWLLKQQRADGSWPAWEYWTNREDVRRSALLTAYVARVLATTEASEVSDPLKHALNYLSSQATAIDEPYLLASYALAAIDARETSRAKPIIEKLQSLAHAEGVTTYWSLETNTPFYGWGLAGRVETTALVVQALTRYCESQDAKCESDTKLVNRALLFLLKQKDRYGVWYSTQATINVLDAMLALLSTNSPQNSGTQSATDVLVNGRIVQTIQVPVGDRSVNPITSDISEFLHTGRNRVELKRPTGSPFASVQAIVNYYVPWSAARAEHHASGLRLVAKFSKTEGKINDEITCNVEAERIGFRGYGMMLAEIGLPPGADVDRSSLDTAMKSSGWTMAQYDVLPDRVVVYLWPRAGGVKFNFTFRPRFGLTAKTASSVVYDYYNPESRAVVPPSTFRVR